MSDDQLRRVDHRTSTTRRPEVNPDWSSSPSRDVRGELGALPLLSHALRATWERREGRTLTVAGYRAAGGVGGAIGQTANELLGGLTPDERQLVRGIFLRLTMGGDGVTETRRRVTLDELVPDGASPRQVTGLLARLTDAMIVPLSDDTVEIAHEALIRAWPTLRGWLDEDRDGIRLRRRLADAARLWETGGHEPTDLYRGPRLAGAVELARRRPGDLNATERSFVEASLAVADGERRAQLRSNRRLRGLLAGAGILLVLAVIAGVVALVQRDHARAQALTSDSERVGLEAMSDPSPDRSLLLGVAGVRLQDRVQTRSDLLAALQRYPALIRVLHPSSTEIDALAIDPSAPILAYGSYGGRIGLIDTNGWASVGAVALGQPVAPRAMAFSPDGRTLLAMTVGPDDAVLHAIDLRSRRTRVLRTWHTPARAATVRLRQPRLLARRSPDRGDAGHGGADRRGTDGGAAGSARRVDRAGAVVSAIPAAPRSGGAVRGVHARGAAADLGPAGRHAALEPGGAGSCDGIRSAACRHSRATGAPSRSASTARASRRPAPR